MAPHELNDDFDFDRRRAIAGGIAALLLTSVTSGCIAGLLRLFVGRGLASSLIRTANIGRAASTLTFGRGVAIGGRVVPANAYRSSRGMIIDPKQRVVATFDTSISRSIVKRQDSPVFTSERTRYGYEHFDRNGVCGRSFANSESNQIIHKTEDDVLLAIDRIDRVSSLVEHLDANGRRIGITRYRQRGTDQVDVVADDGSLRSIDIASRELGLQCPEAKRAHDEWLEAKRLCGENVDAACRSIPQKRIEHESLIKECNR